MTDQPSSPNNIPSAFDLDPKTEDSVFSSRHWIYDIFNRSRHLYDLDDVTTDGDGSLISYEVDTAVDSDGNYRSLRVRESSYSLVTASGDESFFSRPSNEPIERDIRSYVVEAIPRNLDAKHESADKWSPFVALIIDHNDENGVDIFMCDPHTGREFDDLEKTDIMYLLQGMSASLMEEMASQVILTDPDRSDFKADDIKTDVVNSFNPHQWIAYSGCDHCEAGGVFCPHKPGNLN